MKGTYHIHAILEDANPESKETYRISGTIQIEKIEIESPVNPEPPIAVIPPAPEQPEPPIAVIPPSPEQPEPPIVVIPPIQGWILDLDELFANSSGVVRLPFNASSVIPVRSKGMIQPGAVIALIGDQITLEFQDWETAPTQLFDLSGCESFGIRGITFLTPPNRPIVTGFPDKELFGWSRETVKKGFFAHINAPKIEDRERVTYGLCRFAYSSEGQDRIYLIAKNVHHNGFNFTQLKNPYTGNLYFALLDSTIHNPIIEEPQSHYYSPTRIKVRISVSGAVAKIISDHTFDQILTHWGYNVTGVRSILHFDRYAFDISEEKLLDNKRLLIDSADEFHPLDNVAGHGLVLTKQIDATRQTNWIYTYEANNLPTRRTLPEGEFDAYIVYKGNAQFAYPVDKSTTFGDDYWESGVITISQGYGWSWYNQEVSGYIENFQGSGYFRNSGGTGVTQGLTIRDSSFQKNPPVPTADSPLDPKVTEYIQWLESL